MHPNYTLSPLYGTMTICIPTFLDSPTVSRRRVVVHFQRFFCPHLEDVHYAITGVQIDKLLYETRLMIVPLETVKKLDVLHPYKSPVVYWEEQTGIQYAIRIHNYGTEKQTTVQHGQVGRNGAFYGHGWIPENI